MFPKIAFVCVPRTGWIGARHIEICSREARTIEMEADHINPWHDEGKTVTENCQTLCKEDNKTKSGK